MEEKNKLKDSKNFDAKTDAKAEERSLVSMPNMILILCIAVMIAFFSLSSVSSGKDGDYNGKIFLYLGSNYSLINGELKNVDENAAVVPEAEDGTTLVPIRFVAEQLKYDVTWNSKNKTATVTDGTKTVALTPDKDVMTVNGNEVKLLLPAKSENGRILVPLRAVAEAFNKEVDYSKGLISISDTKDLLSDSSFNDEIIRMINILPVAKTKDELIKIFNENKREIEYIDDMITTNTTTMSSSDTTNSSSLGTTTTTQNSSSSSASQEVVGNNSDYSETNTQVEGVDEADLLKTDGKYLYQVNVYATPKIVVFDISNPSSIKQVSEFQFEFAGTTASVPIELYVDGDKIIVIANAYERMRLDEKYIAENKYYISEIENGYREKRFTKMYVINAADKSNLKLEKISEIEGEYVTSRKINDVVYLISSKYISDEYDIMPLYYETFDTSRYHQEKDKGTFLDFKETDLNNIKCILPMNLQAYVTVGAVNINSKDAMNVQAYLGAGSNVYASTENLYIAATYRNKEKVTDVMKFSLDGTNVTYINKTTVQGEIINQYSMDENNGYFRIATNSNAYARVDGRYKYEHHSNVFILDDFLNKVGELTHIAPNEDMYSTRFLGDRVYMITFEDVDPLFVIDLADPKNPKILGELKIPGYSSYLHPYDENHIIGIGRDVEVSERGWFGEEKGIKLSLFDITDLKNPVEQYVEIIGDYGETDILYDPKAFLFSKEKEILALPAIVAYQGNAKNPVNSVFQGMYVYKLNLEEGFKFLYRVTHLTDEEYKKHLQEALISDPLNVITRGLYVGDVLFTSSTGRIKANSLYSGKELDSLKITQSRYKNTWNE